MVLTHSNQVFYWAEYGIDADNPNLPKTCWDTDTLGFDTFAFDTVKVSILLNK